jgi:uncharacterized delta-60 repeat protein
LDESFSSFDFAFDFTSIVIGPQNEIVYSGWHNGSTKAFKLSSEGVPVNSLLLASGSSNGNYVEGLAIQPDGKILIASDFESYNGVAANSIIRLLPDGSPDPSFHVPSKFGGTITRVLTVGDKIIVAGSFSSYNNQEANVVELNVDGSLSKIIAVARPNMTYSLMHTDGKLSIYGMFETVNGIAKKHFARFNADGTLDNSFKQIKLSSNNTQGMLFVDNKKRAILGDAFANFKGLFVNGQVVGSNLARVNGLGEPDKNYVLPAQLTGLPFSAALQNDNKFIVNSYDLGNLISPRFNEDGSRDNTFSSNIHFASKGSASSPLVTRQVGTLLYFGGTFDTFNGNLSSSLVALNMDGTLNKTITSLPADSQVSQIEVQSNGKLVLRGIFTFGTNVYHLLRLNNDGSMDDSFTNVKFSQFPGDIAIDEHDNIYCGGHELNPNGAFGNGLIRLFPNGTLDASFNVNSLINSDSFWIYGVETIPGDRVAISGWFDMLTTSITPGVALLNSSGNLIPIELPLSKGSTASDIKYKDGSLFVMGKLFPADQKDTYGLMKLIVDPLSVSNAPTNLAAAVEGDGNVALTWNDPSTNELAFVVEKSVGSNLNFIALDTLPANATSMTDKIERGIEHRYRVYVVNEAGSSTYSTTVNVTWNPPPVGTITLSGTNKQLQASLTWTGNIKYSSGFIIQRSSGASYTAIDTVSTNTLAFAEDLHHGETFSYRVLAYNNFGTVASNNISVTADGTPKGTLSATGKNIGVQVIIDWVANVQFHEGFIVERAAVGKPYEKISTLSLDKTSFTEQVAAGETYTYRVKAYNQYGAITSQEIVMLIVGIQDQERTIQFYPNPARDVLIVTAIEGTETNKFAIRSVDGRTQDVNVFAASVSEWHVDVSGLPRGIYIVEYETKGKTKREKIVLH